MSDIEYVEFDSSDIIQTKAKKLSHCYVIENVILKDSCFYHKGKKLVKHLNRLSYGPIQGDVDLYNSTLYGNETINESSITVEEAIDTLFILEDNWSSNIGHFLTDLFPLCFYFDNYNWGNDVKVGYFKHTEFKRECLEIKYEPNIIKELFVNRVYSIKKLIVPAPFYLIDVTGPKNQIPGRMYNFYKGFNEKACKDYDKNTRKFNKDKLYISRLDTAKSWWHNRVLKNEQALIDVINENNDYDVIELKSLTAKEIIHAVKDRKQIVTQFGATTNVFFFISPNTDFFIINYPNFNTYEDDLVKTITNKMNSTLYTIQPDVKMIYDDKFGNPVLRYYNVPWEIKNIKKIKDDIECKTNQTDNRSYSLHNSAALILHYWYSRNYKSYLELENKVLTNCLWAPINKKVIHNEEDSNTFLNTTSEKFDFIFIDNTRDEHIMYNNILCCMKLLNENGVIMLRDCNPLLENLETNLNLCGNSWKAFSRIRTEFDYLTFCISNADYGMAIIDTSISKCRASKIFGLDYNNLKYSDLESHRIELLNLVENRENGYL
jgi:hypothetical protein